MIRAKDIMSTNVISVKKDDSIFEAIKMLVEKQFSAEMDALLEKTALALSSKSEGSHDMEYEFSNAQVPFAMRIERVRHFNG
jgi:CBS domain-containing protein